MIYPSQDHNAFTYNRYIEHAKNLYNIFTGSYGGQKRNTKQSNPMAQTHINTIDAGIHNKEGKHGNMLPVATPSRKNVPNVKGSEPPPVLSDLQINHRVNLENKPKDFLSMHSDMK